MFLKWLVCVYSLLFVTISYCQQEPKESTNDNDDDDSDIPDMDDVDYEEQLVADDDPVAFSQCVQLGLQMTFNYLGITCSWRGCTR